MDPFRTSRLGLDAAVIVAVDVLVVVMILSARLLSPWLAVVVSTLGVAITALVIAKLRRDRDALEALARSDAYSCDTAPHDRAPRIGHL